MSLMDRIAAEAATRTGCTVAQMRGRHRYGLYGRTLASIALSHLGYSAGEIGAYWHQRGHTSVSYMLTNADAAMREEGRCMALIVAAGGQRALLFRLITRGVLPYGLPAARAVRSYVFGTLLEWNRPTGLEARGLFLIASTPRIRAVVAEALTLAELGWQVGRVELQMRLAGLGRLVA